MTLVLGNGAHMAFNHRENDYVNKIQVCSTSPVNSMRVGGRLIHVCARLFQDATEGHGVNVIIEMLSNVNLSNDLKLLASGGRVTVRGSGFSPRVYYRSGFGTSFLTAVVLMSFRSLDAEVRWRLTPGT